MSLVQLAPSKPSVLNNFLLGKEFSFPTPFCSSILPVLKKKYRINLTKIESRPSKVKAWKYYFFVDMEGHHLDKKISKALSILKRNTTYLKILGSYPAAEVL